MGRNSRANSASLEEKFKYKIALLMIPDFSSINHIQLDVFSPSWDNLNYLSWAAVDILFGIAWCGYLFKNSWNLFCLPWNCKILQTDAVLNSHFGTSFSMEIEKDNK